MAREIKSKKPEETSDVVPIGKDENNFEWSASSSEATSETHLEDDTGEGEAAIIRMFEFKANPEAFRNNPPTKQQLFNAHLKGIEMLLWGDGLKIMTEVEPKLTFNKKKTKYRIFIGAKPMKGHMLLQQPQTLKQIITQ